MRAITLKKKYPEIWYDVYKNVVNDCYDCMSVVDMAQFDADNKDCRIARIAHNAAFFACDAIHKHKNTL